MHHETRNKGDMNKKEILKQLHSYDEMVEASMGLSYPSPSVRALMNEVEKPVKVFNVIQTSNVDGQILVNVTPCESFEIAKAVMDEEVNTLLTEETSKYYGIDLDEMEKRTQDEDDWDCGFNIDRDENHIYITCNVDDYYEYIDIEEKELETNC